MPDREPVRLRCPMHLFVRRYDKLKLIGHLGSEQRFRIIRADILRKGSVSAHQKRV
jgi:hypothetical protein